MGAGQRFEPLRRGSRAFSGSARARAWGCAAILALLQISCVILPVRVAPGVSGRVVDEASGQGVAGALVVVRFDGHYDDVLPDREVLGHRETKTDAQGRFAVGALVRPGISAWPSYQTEARVVAVMSAGYRCPSPQAVPESGDVRVAMRSALDENDRRDSCRPVPAETGEATAYMAAWRSLYPEVDPGPDREEIHQLERLLAARSTFGFGENCEGPALDLALSPDGRRAAFAVENRSDSEVRVVEIRGSQHETADVIASEPPVGSGRLAWASPLDLVLWEPAEDSYQAVSPSVFSGGRFERIWSASGPAAHAFGRLDPTAPSDASAAESVLVPEDLNDEGDSRWRGRSFVLQRRPNPRTGLPQDDLRVYRDDATSYTVALPGEVCGPTGRFGRPHYRIAADGRTGLDLRFVDGGCHVVGTDLETGAWSTLDGVESPGVCRAALRVQATEFRTALRGYTSELEAAIFDAGADPAAAYALRIEPDGTTLLDTRGFEGESLTIEAPPFPIATPLRRIEVTTLGGRPHEIGISKARGSSAKPRLEPL